MYLAEQEISLRNAVLATQAGVLAIKAGETEFDLSKLSIADSSAVAVMLSWQRAASQQGKTLAFHAIPANLNSLLALYGMSELLGISKPHQS
ncbi:STAS domain-containing protein [Undibacterium sp. Ren11W]|uniref:STAS domain-containing protein n=1 Tax=Undibacterium sp. Ren11W TaxID=3413045 RepID=UPI003BF23DB0